MDMFFKCIAVMSDQRHGVSISLATQVSVQLFAQAYIKENIKDPHHVPIARGTIGMQPIPLTTV